MLSPIGIAITTYEGEEYRPTLTHIFWGDSIDEAYATAQSHLITDYFFSGSFHGGIPWKGEFLYLSNNGKVLRRDGYNSIEEMQLIVELLSQRARELDQQKAHLGIIQQIQVLAANN